MTFRSTLYPLRLWQDFDGLLIAADLSHIYDGCREILSVILVQEALRQ